MPEVSRKNTIVIQQVTGFCRKVVSNTLLPTICGIFYVPSFQYVVGFINFATEPPPLPPLKPARQISEARDNKQEERTALSKHM